MLVGHGGVPRDYPRDRLLRPEIPESIDALCVELRRLDIRYARPFAAERLAALFVEHLRQFDLP